MQQVIIETMNQFGYLGVTLLIAIENIFPPIPSEVILTFGGFMTTYTALTAWGVILSATIGSVFGAIVLYYAGRLLSSERLDKLLNGKVGRVLHFSKEEVDYTMNWFLEKGKYSVFFCRCIPILRSLISIPAGAAHMKMPVFLIMTIIGSFIWNVILVHLGVFAGASWDIAVKSMSAYSDLIKIILLIVAAIVVLSIYFKKRNRINA